MAAAVEVKGPDPRLDKMNDACLQQHTDTEDLPSNMILSNYAHYPIFDAQGGSHHFEDLYKAGRVMVIFVRHFFCGMCQDFLRSLCTDITLETLKSARTPSSIVIIGCGQPELIEDYAAKTQCRFPIYADPARKLYEALGMTSTMNQGDKRPSYQSGGILTIAGKSLVQGIAAGSGALKGGNFSQVGGEFLFEEGRITWCHRMRNTRDHTETNDLKMLLGV